MRTEDVLRDYDPGKETSEKVSYVKDIFHISSTSCSALIETLVAFIVSLLDLIFQKDEEAEDLKGKAGLNSTNCSFPPRTDLYRASKPAPSEEMKDAIDPSEDEDNDNGGDDQWTKDKGLRQKTGRHPGKQTGAAGAGMKLPQNAKVMDTVYHYPRKCMTCPFFAQCRKEGKLLPVRHVIDVELTVTDTPHIAIEMCCPNERGKVYSGTYPSGVHSSMQYGSSIRAMSVVLNTLGMVSVSRLHEILHAFFNLQISTGTISSWIMKAGEECRLPLEGILQKITQSACVHCDETGAKVNGVMHWIHTACTEKWTYLSLQAKRGLEGMIRAGFLINYRGTVIHDCLSSYWNEIIAAVRHGLCCAHLLRELKWVIQFKKKNKAWAEGLSELLRKLMREVDEAKARGLKALDKDILEKYWKQYDDYILQGLAMNPAPPDKQGKRGRKKQGKVRSLLLRMQEHKESVLLFSVDFTVPPTNNIAEASFRLVAQKRAVIGGFRSPEGAESFTAIFSVLSTCRKQDINCYYACKAMVEGRLFELLFPGENKEAYVHSAEQRKAMVEEAMTRYYARKKPSQSQCD